jgi:hypothetical protein
MEELIRLQDYKGIFDYVFNLPKHTKDVTGSSGIYFLFKEDIIVYIGISKNIHERILGSRGHIIYKDFDC